jgi:hypothetical protein
MEVGELMEGLELPEFKEEQEVMEFMVQEVVVEVVVGHPQPQHQGVKGVTDL